MSNLADIDARVDYGFYRGSAQEFVAFAMRALRDHHANHHFIGPR